MLVRLVLGPDLWDAIVGTVFQLSREPVGPVVRWRSLVHVGIELRLIVTLNRALR